MLAYLSATVSCAKIHNAIRKYLCLPRSPLAVFETFWLVCRTVWPHALSSAQLRAHMKLPCLLRSVPAQEQHQMAPGPMRTAPAHAWMVCPDHTATCCVVYFFCQFCRDVMQRRCCAHLTAPRYMQTRPTQTRTGTKMTRTGTPGTPRHGPRSPVPQAPTKRPLNPPPTRANHPLHTPPYLQVHTTHQQQTAAST